MESDDDYQQFSTAEQLSPQVGNRSLKRLKKATTVSNQPHPVRSGDEGLPNPPLDSSQSQALPLSEAPILEVPDNPFRSQSSDEAFDKDNELKTSGFDGLNAEDHGTTNRALDFDDRSDEFGGIDIDDKISALKTGTSGKKRLNEEEANEKHSNKKRIVGDGGNANPKRSKSNRRREEKERRVYLQQLHAESQRLLRETGNAAFKPTPVVTKSVSSVLEKIRSRKLELSKKHILINDDFNTESTISSREAMAGANSQGAYPDTSETDKFQKAVLEEKIARHVDVDCRLDASHVVDAKESATNSSHKSYLSPMALNEESIRGFRAPIDDTQDHFCDSQSGGINEMSNDQQGSPLEEVLAPSLPEISLKIDSAPLDDTSDEEDNDKENIHPYPHGLDNGCSSPEGDPVKAFVDEEAVEEDDSDNDQLIFQENEEEEDSEDLEELNDMITAEYEENPIDKERRNELHQKWLEQQDATGTNNLLRRLKCGLNQNDGAMLDEEKKDDGDDNEGENCGDESAEEETVPTNLAQISRKARQMISHMFSDKDDTYLSSDDEETEKRLVKQRLIDTAERATFLSPAEDESSREVFGLIKKLNITPETKKKAKSSFFDLLLTGANSSNSSKSSFLGRTSSHSFPSSHKQGKSMVKSFIFGRDDSVSRSSFSILEDSSDTAQRENCSVRKAISKFRSLKSNQVKA